MTLVAHCEPGSPSSGLGSDWTYSVYEWQAAVRRLWDVWDDGAEPMGRQRPREWAGFSDSTQLYRDKHREVGKEKKATEKLQLILTTSTTGLLYRPRGPLSAQDTGRNRFFCYYFFFKTRRCRWKEGKLNLEISIWNLKNGCLCQNSRYFLRLNLNNG